MLLFINILLRPMAIQFIVTFTIIIIIIIIIYFIVRHQHCQLLGQIHTPTQTHHAYTNFLKKIETLSKSDTRIIRPDQKGVDGPK